MVAATFWSRELWRSIHAIAWGYAERRRQLLEGDGEVGGGLDPQPYRAFFLSLGPVLPCDTCTVGYAAHLDAGAGLLRQGLEDALGPDAPPEALFDWTVQLHNAVTIRVRDDEKNGSVDLWTPERAREAMLANRYPSSFQGAPSENVMALGVALTIGCVVGGGVLWGVYAALRTCLRPRPSGGLMRAR